MSRTGDASHERPSPERAIPTTLGSLWEKHRPTISRQLDLLDDAVMALLQGTFDVEDRRQAEAAAHRLGGSVGTFGFSEASAQARTVETLLQGEGVLGQKQILQLADLVVALRIELTRPARSHSDKVVPAAAGGDPEGKPGEGTESLTASDDRDPISPHILVVSVDTGFLRRLEVEAASRGLTLRSASLGTALAMQPRQCPSLLLLDLSDPEQTQDGLSLMDRVKEWPGRFPIVVLTTWNSFVDRIEAVRRGAHVFLHRPISEKQVIEVAHRVLEKGPEQKPHVLLVDDDLITREMAQAILEKHHLQVTTVATPAELWRVLQERPCDLLILDVGLPDINGLELCRAIRGDPHFETLPIMFLTSYGEQKTVQAMFDAGADDYVQKPIIGPDLVNRVLRRIERTRLRHARSIKDPATGVLNAEHACSQAELLFKLGRHVQEPVTVALIRVCTGDVGSGGPECGEAMKPTAEASVPEGDAMQQMGRLLSLSFPRVEVVGRWNRDTFIVAFIANLRKAEQRLSSVLRQFNEVATESQDGHGASSRVVAVAGLADFPECGWEFETVVEAARSALDATDPTSEISIEWHDKNHLKPTLHVVDVALVEDDSLLVELLTHSLQIRGLTTCSFLDGQVALDALASDCPTVQARVIVLDVALPTLDGLSVLRRLSREGVLRHSRVIMLTFRDTEAEVLQALDLGAFDHVSKPFSLPILLHRIRRAMTKDAL